jgi:hypothetical protein
MSRSIRSRAFSRRSCSSTDRSSPLRRSREGGRCWADPLVERLRPAEVLGNLGDRPVRGLDHPNGLTRERVAISFTTDTGDGRLPRIVRDQAVHRNGSIP